MRLRTLLLGSFLICSSPLSAQDRLLTIDDLFDPRAKIDFGGSSPGRLTWMKDGRHYLQASPSERVSAGSERLLKVDARSGESEPLFDERKLETEFLNLAGFDESEARQAARKGELTLSPDEEKLLIDYEGDLYAFDLSRERLERLTHTPEKEEVAEWSPSSHLVAFVRSHDLYCFDLKSGKEIRLTASGGPELRNGILDWVYQEEIYGRHNFRAFWWSPDSTRIAYLRLDDSLVPRYSVVDHLPIHPDIEVLHYPKAGDPNPEAGLGVVAVQDGKTGWADLAGYADRDILIVNVDWRPGGEGVIFQVQDRQQTWLDLLEMEPEKGTVKRLFREASEFFVNVLSSPHWLSDGSFIWESERSGFRHLYLYSRDGALQKAITGGEWEVTRFEGMGSADLYFTATRHSPRESHLYRVPLSGGEAAQVTERKGTHSVQLNPEATLFIDSWSDLLTPPQVSLHEASGEKLRTIEENRVEALVEYALGKTEFFQVETRDGFLMEALMITPPDFDPSRKYPVLSYAYSGPHAPQVKDRWGGTRLMWHQMLAQKGFIIWICDNRSASGKGIKSAWQAHRNLGELELRDLEDGLDWLKKKPFVDPERIGLWGWSYGGYMTAYALTHSRSFKVGIAGAPVTDWHLYDSIYTERYMGMPQNNREGYKKSSAIEAAADLHGRLLLIHGTIDENVHLQNSLKFAHALQKAGKPFQLMLYPGNRHGVSDAEQSKHLYSMMTDFIMDHL